jgi:hypothetical protein
VDRQRLHADPGPDPNLTFDADPAGGRTSYIVLSLSSASCGKYFKYFGQLFKFSWKKI